MKWKITAPQFNEYDATTPVSFEVEADLLFPQYGVLQFVNRVVEPEPEGRYDIATDAIVPPPKKRKKTKPKLICIRVIKADLVDVELLQS